MTRPLQLSLALALLAGAVARFWGLGDESLWLDELFSVRAAGRESWGTLVEEVRLDVHPPGYFALLRLWMMVSGGSEWAVRAPSAIAGWLGLVGVFALARRLWGERTAAAAVWLLALAPFAVALDREARGNALLSTLSVWSAYALVRPSRRYPWGYALVSAAMLWTHVFGLAVLAAHGLWAGLDAWAGDRARLRTWALGAAGALLAFAPWGLTLLGQTRSFAADPWYNPPPADSLGWLAPTLAGGAGLAVLLTVGVGLALRAPTITGSRWLPAMVLGVLLLPHAASMVVAPVLRDRNAIALVPAWTSTAAAGLVEAGAGWVGVLAGAGALAIARQAQEPPREQWREAAEIVRSGWIEGDRVDANHVNLWRHYLPEVEDEPAAPRRIWVVRAHDGLDEPVPAELGEVVEERWLRGAVVRLVEPAARPVRFEALGAPMWQDEALHFYWDAVAVAPGALHGTCRVGLAGRADLADGVGAALEVRLRAGEAMVASWPVSLGADETVWWSPDQAVEGATLEIAFLNDGTGTGTDGAPADRNAHLRKVWVRCR